MHRVRKRRENQSPKKDTFGGGGSAERRFCREKPSLIVVNIVVAQVKFGSIVDEGQAGVEKGGF